MFVVYRTYVCTPTHPTGVLPWGSAFYVHTFISQVYASNWVHFPPKIKEGLGQSYQQKRKGLNWTTEYNESILHVKYARLHAYSMMQGLKFPHFPVDGISILFLSSLVPAPGPGRVPKSAVLTITFYDKFLPKKMKLTLGPYSDGETVSSSLAYIVQRPNQ